MCNGTVFWILLRQTLLMILLKKFIQIYNQIIGLGLIEQIIYFHYDNNLINLKFIADVFNSLSWSPKLFPIIKTS